MKFKLEIELGGKSMDCYSEIFRALQISRPRLYDDDPVVGDFNTIRDEDGKVVGKWEITA